MSIWITNDWFDTFDGFIGFISQLVGAGAILLLCVVFFILAFSLFKYETKAKKTYRGIGFIYCLNTILFCFPIVLVVAIITLTSLEINLNLFNFVWLFAEFSIPLIIALFIKKELKNKFHFCLNCGLINSFSVISYDTKDLGTTHKFHNEGGYTEIWKASDGVIINTVPTTAVYDGEFERTRTTIGYKCVVCGNEVENVNTTETKI
ncbi:MAG: hypothetical protein IJW64_05170 [Clostridia bacterium]|nr:hypothetical protein [Clostridia bacterium]